MQNDKQDLCIYCGSSKECREHVIPVVYTSLSRSYDPSSNWLVPSCKICNELAGSEVFFSIPEKAKYILKRYKSKFKKRLNMPEWTQDELDELDHLMRESVMAGLIAKRVLLEKIGNIKKTTELPTDFNRPHFIELQIEDMIKEYQELLEKNKKEIKRLKRKKKNGK